MKTLIGMVTFGNIEFTKLAVQEIRATTKAPIKMVIVAGKEDDRATREWMRPVGVGLINHGRNWGFPASINDLYDAAFSGYSIFGDFDNLIIAGNDIVPYPGAIDALIHAAETTDYEWFCSSQFHSGALVERYPQARKFFEGPDLIFRDFGSRPWELFESDRVAELHKIEQEQEKFIEPNCIKDVRNLTLFKRSVFEKIGYADVNFWPGGYFEDNDYCRRAMLAGVKACGLRNSIYFHFWSRTINQGPHSGADRSLHDIRFRRNETYYHAKWGAAFGAEKYEQPFNDMEFHLGVSGTVVRGGIKISDRSQESAIVDYWSQL